MAKTAATPAPATASAAPSPVQSAAQSTINSLVDDLLGGGGADNQVDTQPAAAADPAPAAGDAGDAPPGVDMDDLLNLGPDDEGGKGKGEGDADTATDDAAATAPAGDTQAANDAAPAAAANDAQQAESAHAATPAQTASLILEEIGSIEQRIASGDIDPVDDFPEVVGTLIKQVKKLAEATTETQAAAAPQRAAAAAGEYWSRQFTKDYPGVNQADGKQIFGALVERCKAKGLQGQSLRDAVGMLFPDAVKAHSARQAASPRRSAAPSTAAAQGRTQVAPGNANRPPIKPKTLDQRIESGEYGNVLDEIGM